jgi:hypothetical protein
MMSSKRKRAEPSSKAENSRRKKAVRAKSKPPLAPDEEYSEESEAEMKKFGKTGLLDSSNVKAAAASRRLNCRRLANDAEVSDDATDPLSMVPLRESNLPREGKGWKGPFVIEISRHNSIKIFLVL